MGSQQTTPINWYDQPIYYDIIFAPDTVRECDFIAAAWQKFGAGRLRRILEPACGSGRLVAELASRGHQVTGFDRNLHMLDFARDRLRQLGRRASLHQGELAAFDVGQNFDLAHCFVSTFKYLLTEADATSHLAHVAAALRPGGLYLLGFHLSDYAHPAGSRERWFGRRGDIDVACTIESRAPQRRQRLEAVRSRLLVRHGRRQQRLATDWQFRTYSVGQVRRLLRQVPSLSHLATFDFDYQIEQPQPFDGERLDCVLVLRQS